jgi:hypothetical protein
LFGILSNRVKREAGEAIMKFNLKVILLGGLPFHATQFILSMAGCPVIRENILNELYLDAVNRPKT